MHFMPWSVAAAFVMASLAYGVVCYGLNRLRRHDPMPDYSKRIERTHVEETKPRRAGPTIKDILAARRAEREGVQQKREKGGA